MTLVPSLHIAILSSPLRTHALFCAETCSSFGLLSVPLLEVVIPVFPIFFPFGGGVPHPPFVCRSQRVKSEMNLLGYLGAALIIPNLDHKFLNEKLSGRLPGSYRSSNKVSPQPPPWTNEPMGRRAGSEGFRALLATATARRAPTGQPGASLLLFHLSPTLLLSIFYTTLIQHFFNLLLSGEQHLMLE